MPEQDQLITNVTDEKYDGRSFVPEDNQGGVENYIGVDPIYQNYANEAEKPHAFTDEELKEAAVRGGVSVDANDDEADDEDGDEQPVAKKAPAKKAAATPPSAAIPEQKTGSPTSK
jgi:hypothetical protein